MYLCLRRRSGYQPLDALFSLAFFESHLPKADECQGFFRTALSQTLVKDQFYGWIKKHPDYEKAYFDFLQGQARSWWEDFLKNHFRKELINESKLGRLASLKAPADVYLRSRPPRRHLYFHLGPTNSGKTHHALRRMEDAKVGIYCSPLRLLAQEVYQKLDPARRELRTGEDHLPAQVDHKLIACTVEMCPLAVEADVMVLDEIQMIEDPFRGFAWTRAFLGGPAREIHLCGERRALEIYQKLGVLCGDQLVRTYEYTRLSTLLVQETPLIGSDLEHLEFGDCLVCFSRKQCFEIRELVEAAMKVRGETDYQILVLYGNLPSHTRNKIRLQFNANFQRSILIATDCLGLGVNLQIQRIIFWRLAKFDGEGRRPLRASEIRQLAGRAARYGHHRISAAQVAAIHEGDLHILKEALNTKETQSQLILGATSLGANIRVMPAQLDDTLATNIPQAFIFPEFNQIQEFASVLQISSFVEALEGFYRHSSTSADFQLSDLSNIRALARLAEPFKLSAREIYEVCMIPVHRDNLMEITALKELLTQFHQSIIRFPEEYLVHEEFPLENEADLRILEACYHIAQLFLHLCVRFPQYRDEDGGCRESMRLCQTLIEQGLEKPLSEHGGRTPQFIGQELE